MTRILFFAFILISGNCFAQELWGSLTPGQHSVGFKLIRERDNTRAGRPMLVSLWYPAVPSASATTVLFKDYLASGIITPSFSEPSATEKTHACVDFHDLLEKPFVMGLNDIPDAAYNRVLNLPTAAKWNQREVKGKFPAVLMSSEPESLAVTAEYLASNGFVVVAISAPYGQQQPPDSLLWVQPTADILWLMNYTQKLKNIDQSKLTCLGFGGGIQSPFFLTMKTDRIQGLVNLEGGVFGPRSLTDKSVEYQPEKMKTPMLHIVTQGQRNEDAALQQQALVNSKLYRATIEQQALRHHDFSIFGRVVNKGLKMHGDLSDVADKAYAAVHSMILEFLKLAISGKAEGFVIDRRYMPLLSLDNSFQTPEPGLVLHQPGMDKVMVEEGKKFMTMNDSSLVFDIYYPQGFDKKQDLPVVVFVNGIGSMELYRWKIYQDWAKLIAANGMIAVNYQARRNALADSEYFLDYLGKHSGELAIDKERIALWACSANVGVGLPLAMQDARRSIKALVVYYGMVQMQSDTRPSHRQDLEIQIVRAGLDFHNLNVNIESFVRRAITDDLHFEMINYPEGQHAFDAFDDTSRSREIILQTVDFFKRTLSKDHPVPSKTVLTNARLWNLIVNENKIDETLKEWKDGVAMYRRANHTPWYNHVIDERNLNQMGYQLIEAGRTSDALKVFIANQEQFTESANVYDALADAYEKAGDKPKAVANSKKALEKLGTQTNLQPQMRDAIRKSAEDKIRRLQ